MSFSAPPIACKSGLTEPSISIATEIVECPDRSNGKSGLGLPVLVLLLILQLVLVLLNLFMDFHTTSTTNQDLV